MATNDETFLAKDGHTVFVSNIPFSVRSAELKRVFSSFGDILYTNIIYNSSGKSRGFGFVAYKCKESQSRAINKNGKLVIRGRRLNIKVAIGTKTVTQAQSKESFMHLLNDDCLVQIFRLLDFKELSLALRVCKKWYHIIKNMRSAKKCLKLDCSSIYPVSLKVLNNILRDCKQLVELDISNFFMAGSLRNLGVIIGRCCPNLEKIVFGKCLSKHMGFQTLFVKCKNLKEIAINDGSCFDDSILTKLFKHCPILERLIIEGQFELIGKNCGLPPSNLSCLNLNESSNVCPTLLINIAENCHQMKELHLDKLKVTPECIDSICNNMPLLEVLSLNNVSYFVPLTLTNLYCLSQLKTLNFNGNLVSSATLQSIGKCKTLKSLELGGLDEMLRSEDLHFFEGLELLETLKLQSTMVDSEGIPFLAALKELKSLDLSDCCDICDDDVRLIFHGQGKLSELNVSGTDISPLIYDDAVDYVLSNKTKLTMTVSFGMLDFDIAELPEGLTILQKYNSDTSGSRWSYDDLLDEMFFSNGLLDDEYRFGYEFNTYSDDYEQFYDSDYDYS